MADPGRHVHEPRRRRAPRADHRPGRRPGRDVQAGTFHAVCARVLRRDGAAIGHRSPLRDLRHGRPADAHEADPAAEDMPATRRVPAVGHPRRDQPGQERDGRPDALEEVAAQPPRADGRPARPRLPGAAEGRRGARLRRPPARGGPPVPRSARRAAPATRSAGATSTSTNTRTRTGRSTCGSGRSRRATTTSPSWATTTSRSTRGAARTCATSSTSSATSRTPPWSSSSRTTARRS